MRLRKLRTTRDIAGESRRLRFESLEERRLLAITVNSLTDEADGSITDGDISLRDAIAAATPGETIDFNVAGTLTLTLGQLTINKSLTIDGPGAEQLTISGDNASRIFWVDDASASIHADVTMSGLTLTQGRLSTPTFNADRGAAIYSVEDLSLSHMVIMSNHADDDGGAIYSNVSNGSVLAIYDSVITGNSANRHGGGVYVNGGAGGTLNIERSTFSYNRAGVTLSGGGGGVQLRLGANANVTIASSTFSANSARAPGGGIGIDFGRDANIHFSGLTVSSNQASQGAGIHLFQVAPITIAHSTISGNKTTTTGAQAYGGGISLFLSTLMLENTIVAGNQGGRGPDIRSRSSTIVARYNLIGDNTESGLAAAPVGSPDPNGNLIGASGPGAINPRLAPLADVSGPTKTHALKPDSPALDAGNAAIVGAPAFDQRGTPFARIFDGDGAGGARIDIGAFESQPVAAASELIVTTGIDEVDGDLSAGDLSLREAVGLANTDPQSVQTISFAAPLHGSTIRLTHGTLQLTGSTVINGPGAELLAIEGIGFSRNLAINDGDTTAHSSIEIRDITIRGGNAQVAGSDAGHGGGIRSAENLLLQRSRITGNKAAADGGGGYVYSVGGGMMALEQNTFEDNEAGNRGGGLVIASASAATMEDNSITLNSALRNGGGVFAVALNNGTLAMRNSEISGNEAEGAGGGLYLIAAAAGHLDVSRANIHNNVAKGAASSIHRGGGGITIGSITGGQVRVRDSTINDNDATARGGGVEVFNQQGDVLLSNVTISDNRSAGDAGGIWAGLVLNGTNRVLHSTITGNLADSDNSGAGAAGGVFAGGGPLELRNAVVAGNMSNATSPDLGFSSTGVGSGPGNLQLRYTLVGNNTGSGLTPAPVGAPDGNGNLIGGSGAAVIDALLGPLEDNGGPTMTHALLEASPAIDSGDPAAMAGVGDVPRYDQRGGPFTRVFDGDGIGGERIDMGAVELQTVSPVALGDYNLNGFVDAADFVVWRKMLGANVAAFSGADGSGNMVIDEEDYGIWRAHFGATLEQGGISTGGALAAVMQHPADVLSADTPAKQSAGDAHVIAAAPPALPGVAAARLVPSARFANGQMTLQRERALMGFVRQSRDTKAEMPNSKAVLRPAQESKSRDSQSSDAFDTVFASWATDGSLSPFKLG
jgi:hypothetical protein